MSYSTTGFGKKNIRAIVGLMVEVYGLSQKTPGTYYSLTARESVMVALTYLRRNRTQEELAEEHGVSQPTISRVIGRYSALLLELFGKHVPRVEDLPKKGSVVVDGTLLSCWSWKNLPALYSGKHHTTGLSVQVVCDLDGELLHVSEPVNGNTHDAKAITESGILGKCHPARIVADKGYIGRGMVTPERKPPDGELTENQKKYNSQVNAIRYVVERAIAHLKTWRILHTDFRRPFDKFKDTIKTVLALEFYRKTINPYE